MRTNQPPDETMMPLQSHGIGRALHKGNQKPSAPEILRGLHTLRRAAGRAAGKLRKVCPAKKSPAGGLCPENVSCTDATNSNCSKNFQVILRTSCATKRPVSAASVLLRQRGRINSNHTPSTPLMFR